jgi:PhzF family phenazine biosynthesis protein
VVLRYTAFSGSPEGGNPAGLVLDATGMEDGEMLAVAAELGYSESAFLTPAGPGEYHVRFFSPVAEVPFCGHATVAAGVALAERHGDGAFLFHTLGGDVGVRAEAGMATLTSATPYVEAVPEMQLALYLEALRWHRRELDPALPPRVAFAGARHLVLAASTRERLAHLSYDFEALKALMLEDELTTVHLVWRESALVFHARDPFPVGGKVEDPATGAAAAAFGAYLRELDLVRPPARITVRQGQDMGRPSELRIELEEGRDEVMVTGAAVPLL